MRIKLWCVVVCALLLTSCGGGARGAAWLTGWSKVCVEGVSYLQFPSGVTVQYDRAGKVVSCS